MKITIRVDLSDFDMRGKKKQLIKGVKRGIKASGVRATRVMQRIAPVDQGHYRSSIFPEFERGRMGVTIGPHKNYAIYVEKGTRPHEIRPKKPGGFLAFKTKGGANVVTRSVRHPGTKPQKIVERTAKTMEKIAPTIIRREIGRALR